MEGNAYLVIALSFGLAGGIVAKLKGNSFVLWFVIAGLIPFLGLAAAILYRQESEELRKQCPNCGRITALYDALCMKCGHELDFPDVAIEPEAVARARRA